MGNLLSIKKYVKKSNTIHLLIDEINKKEEKRIIDLSKSQLKSNQYTKNDILINLKNYMKLYDLKSKNNFLLLKDYIVELENSKIN